MERFDKVVIILTFEETFKMMFADVHNVLKRTLGTLPRNRRATDRLLLQ